MTFPYIKITREIERPIIPVILTAGKKFVIYSALIDSGADYCIFSIELAQALRVVLSHREKVSFRGVGKGKIKGYWGNVEIKVGKAHYATKAIFAEISDFGHGILGQKGFFDHRWHY